MPASSPTSSDACWLRCEGDDVLLTFHVQPGARTSGIAGVHGDALKLRLAAPPVDGKANACLVAYLAGLLQLPRAQIAIVSGASGRRKLVRITGAGRAVLPVLMRLASQG